jgi:hypothetical protein
MLGSGRTSWKENGATIPLWGTAISSQPVVQTEESGVVD